MRSVCVVGVALALAATGPALRVASSVVLLNDLVGGAPLGAWSAPLRAAVVTREQTLELPGARRTRAREYVPDGVADAPGIVLLHGVHPRGIDEARLKAFARTVAASGVRVLTPELSELLRYRIDAATVRTIRDVTAVHARNVGRASATVVGISFAGGLALMAAAEQGGAAPIGAVVTVGSHHDLLRLCRYYAGEPVFGPEGEPVEVAPHPYGARVMMREHLERFFDPQDLPIARRALDTYLRDEHRKARAIAERISARGRPVIDVLLRSEASPELAGLLSEAAAAVTDQLVHASPKGHLAGLQAPVFLVHGREDPIIPSIESRWLAREVPPAVLRQLVITPLLRHAEFPKPPSFAETWELVRFMRDILQSANSAQRSSP